MRTFCIKGPVQLHMLHTHQASLGGSESGSGMGLCGEEWGGASSDQKTLSPQSKAKNDENSPVALNVKNDTIVTAAWCPESFKVLHLDLVAIKSRLYFANEKQAEVEKVIRRWSHCLLAADGD